MPQPTLLIDGYNLMHAIGIARASYGPRDLERARERLLTELASLLDADQRSRTVVVFDARGSGQSYRATMHRHGIRVEYPAAHFEADDRIETLIDENTAPKSLVVVSGDRRLHRAIERRRGRAENGPAFVARLLREQADVPIEEEKPQPGRVSDREVREWTRRIFGGE